MSPRTNSSHNSSPSNQSLTMSSSITNSPAGLTNNILNSSPHSNNSPHNVQNSSPPQGDELLNNQLNDNNLINNLNNSLTNQTNDNGLNQLVLNNQSPLNSTSSPLSNGLNNSNNLLKQDQELKAEMYNQTNLNGLLSNNQNLSPPLNKMNRKLDTNETSLNTSINSTNLSANLNQQQLSTSTVQWTGTQTPTTNYSASRYQQPVNSSTYQTTPTNQFGSNNSNSNNLNNISNSNNQSLNPSSINLNSSNQQSNLNTTTSSNSPYLDFNLNNNYTGSMLNHAPSTPNMFTAAAVAASKNQSSNLNNQNSDFSFNNNNNNLTKKYLESPANLPTSGLDTQLDQQLFYGNSTTNGITPLSKSTTSLQSNSTTVHKPEFISTSLTNNYANFAPNSNASYWQAPGTTSQQCMTNASNMYQPKQIQSNNLNHTPPSGQQIDEASQASTPNSQLDELRSDTPNTKLSNNQINSSTYLTSTINGVSNNSSSNSSTGSMASSANSISLNNGKNGMPVYSFPPTPNTIGSPGASVMSGFYDEYEPVQNTTWSKNHRLDGLMKLYEISNEPGRKIFLDKLVLFNEECGNTVSSCPTISKSLIDLYRLYCLVKDRGGFLQTTKSKQWKEVANLILNNTKLQPTSAYILRKQYIRHLLPFECKYDLGGADPKIVLQQIENANRKKRKNKPGNDPLPGGMQTPPNTIDNQLNNNLVINKNNLNQMQLNQQPPPPPSANSNHPNMNSSIGVSPINQNIQLNRHLTMQQQTNFQQTTNPNNLPPNSIMPNGPNQFHTTPGGITLNSYSNYNYNSNLPGANYMQNGPQFTNAPNSGYNQTTIDYQNKLNHQLNQQNQQFFTNSSQINQTSSSANQLVNPSQQLHSSIPSNNQQSSNLNNPTSLPSQQYYQQNNTMFNLSLNGQQTNDNFFYSNQLNSVHNSSTTANQQLNNMQFSDEMINKYNTSLKQELNSSQSSLPTNQLNNSNNTQYYSGYQDNTTIHPNYSTSVYGRSQPPTQQQLSQSNNYQINGYSNGIIDNSFDKTNSNLLDFQSTIKTESNNLDYLSDPYSYEPDNKRVCF